MMTLPRVKSFEARAGRLALPGLIPLCVHDADDYPGRFARAALGEQGVHTGIAGPGAPLAFHRDPALEAAAQGNPDYYIIEIDNSGVRVHYWNQAGARHGVWTLCQLLRKTAEGWDLPLCRITDYPDFPRRGVMLDPARKHIPAGQLKGLIRMASLAGMNELQLHLLDSGGYALESQKYPLLNSGDLPFYTQGEMREIIEYAAFYGLEVIPQLEMPAHGEFALTRYPGLQCDTQTVAASKWAACIGNEDTYTFYTGLLAEVFALFPSKTVHIGGDELEFSDLEELKYWPTWDDCARCKALEARGVVGKRQQFYHFIGRIYDFFKANGRQMMMWNDGIDVAVSPPVPRDILLHFWRIAMPRRGPVEGCSMTRFLEEGYQLVNSDFPEAYIDLYIKEENLLRWSPLTLPEAERTPESAEVDPRYAKQVLGGCMCAWEGKPHFERNLPGAIVMFGGRLWNRRPDPPGPAYSAALTRAVLGPSTPEGFDLFALLGGCLLPYEDDQPARPTPAASPENLARARRVLTDIKGQNRAAQAWVDEYLGCLDWLEKHPAAQARPGG